MVAAAALAAGASPCASLLALLLSLLLLLAATPTAPLAAPRRAIIQLLAPPPPALQLLARHATCVASILLVAIQGLACRPILILHAVVGHATHSCRRHIRRCAIVMGQVAKAAVTPEVAATRAQRRPSAGQPRSLPPTVQHTAPMQPNPSVAAAAAASAAVAEAKGRTAAALKGCRVVVAAIVPVLPVGTRQEVPRDEQQQGTHQHSHHCAAAAATAAGRCRRSAEGAVGGACAHGQQAASGEVGGRIRAAGAHGACRLGKQGAQGLHGEGGA